MKCHVYQVGYDSPFFRFVWHHNFQWGQLAFEPLWFICLLLLSVDFALFSNVRISYHLFKNYFSNVVKFRRDMQVEVYANQKNLFRQLQNWLNVYFLLNFLHLMSLIIIDFKSSPINVPKVVPNISVTIIGNIRYV